MKTLRERLEEKIMPVTETGCWLWTGFTDKHGYGRVGLGGGVSKFAHRMMWQEVHGVQIPKGMFVCHKCDTPACCNPSHLFIGNHQDNMDDRNRKGRQWQQRKTHCKHGHEFSVDNTYVEKGAGRHCNTCRKNHGSSEENKAKRRARYRLKVMS